MNLGLWIYWLDMAVLGMLFHRAILYTAQKDWSHLLTMLVIAFFTVRCLCYQSVIKDLREALASIEKAINRLRMAAAIEKPQGKTQP